MALSSKNHSTPLADNPLRFSGHETFPCRIHWLHRGMSYLAEQNFEMAAFNKEDAVVKLGVGKNMVRSIQYWLYAFGLDPVHHADHYSGLKLFDSIDENNDQPWDEYIEDEATLWLLHFMIIASNYATLYPFVFERFPNKRPMLEFTVSSMTRFVQTQIQEIRSGSKATSENSIKKDIQVLLSLYGANKKMRNPEEDAIGLFIHLDLIRPTGQMSDSGEPTYILHRTPEPRVPIDIFTFCLLKKQGKREQYSFDVIHEVAQLFGATYEGTEYLIDQLVQEKGATYSSSEGVKNLTFTGTQVNPASPIEVLKNHYESVSA